MDLSRRLSEIFGSLHEDESAILASLQAPCCDHLCRPTAEIEPRHCRASFLIELIKLLSGDSSHSLICLPNLRLIGPLKGASLRCEKALLLHGLTSVDSICLDQASFLHLELTGARFPSLLARNLQVERDLVLTGARISNVLDLTAARIGGALDLRNADLTAPFDSEGPPEHQGETDQSDQGHVRREAYQRQEMGCLLDGRVEGSVRLCDAVMDRRFRMTNARIGCDLDLWGVTFRDLSEVENGLICTNCEIGEKLILSQTICGENTRIAVDYSRMCILQFGRDQNVWPRAGRISLEGTTFNALTFIERQKPGYQITVFDKDLTVNLLLRNGPGFYRQPWRQAAHSMRQKGYNDEALEILVAMECEAKRVEAREHASRIKDPALGAGQRLAMRFKRARRKIFNTLWWFADYGYRPEKVLWVLLLLLAGNVLINLTIIQWRREAIVPALEDVYLSGELDPWAGSPREYPDFNPVVFALDTMISPLDLGQERAWQPNWKDPVGFIYAIYLYLFHMLFGLILIGVLVAGITKRLSDDL